MQEIIKYVENKKEEIKSIVSSLKCKIKLIIVQLNDNPASNAYIKGKISDCGYVGIEVEHIKLDPSTTQEELFKLIDKLNKDKTVTGIIVQLPLPKHIDESEVARRIDPKKDVDGFNPLTLYNPATPFGILTYLEDNKFEFIGKNAVVLGRSNIVGKPMARLLLNKDMNVTVLHSKTKLEDQKFFIKNADLVVVSIGKGYYIDDKFTFKKSAVVIDVGITRNNEGKLIGDCIPNLNVYFQSPVPKGVGLLTRLSLLLNLVKGGKIQNGL